MPSLAVHEMGHFFGFKHTFAVNSTMFYVVFLGADQSILEQDDIQLAARGYFNPAALPLNLAVEGAVLRGEDSVAELCRCEGISANLYYRWSKDFLEAGKKRLAGDIESEATSNEVVDLRKQLAQLKEVVAETVLENRVLKKTAVGFDSGEADT